MSPEAGALLGVLGAGAAIVGAGVAIVVMRKVIAGSWGLLSSRYPSVNVDLSEEMRFRSLLVRFSTFAHLRFGFCTAFKITDQSVHIRIQFPTGILCRPVSLPWTAVQNIELKKSFLGYPLAIVHVKDFSPVLIIPMKAGRLIYDKWCQRSVANA